VPRGALRRLDIRIAFEAGQLRADILERRAGAVEALLPGLLPAMLATARRVLLAEAVPERLADNALHDPVAAVRVHCLEALAGDYRDHPATPGVLRAAGADASVDVRLQAAAGLGEEGRAVLLDMAAHEGLEESVRARAVGALDRHAPPDRVQAILAEARRSDQNTLACACIAALGRLGGPAAQPLLLDLLRQDVPRLHAAAATALGSVGTADAVLPLKKFAEITWLGARSAALRAVDDIRARLTVASPGQLSLSAGDGGQVSLADPEAGRLSLSERGTPGTE
jgi:HEAT repeat protein